MDSPDNPYILLFRAASLIPISHYLWGFLSLVLVFLYNFLEIHLFEDIFNGFRGNPISLTFTPGSDIYESVVSKCKVLHGRYLVTWWLASPHLQTTFLNFHGRPPVFTYRRKIFHTSDGGNVALDWLLKCDVSGDSCQTNNTISKDDTTPIVVVVPGLTSDSNSPYMKHLVFDLAKYGWNVVVGNHRGLGGTSITSDCFYNAGWTDDVRSIINFLHHEYPQSPLFVVGTSIGANVLVKYLGEDGEDVPVAGAVAICSPWDLLIGDRFINRRLHQKLYDKALTIGLQGYAHLHQAQYSRLADWEGIKKSRSIRDFDNYATCIVGKFETVDTYYRRCSSSSFVGNVSVPLLCISALDDPVCTREAIPWDECRVNKNIVLATTQHGGHLAFFEGMTASKLWWVRAVNEFLDVLHSSAYMHKQKKLQNPNPILSLASSIDHGPFVNVGDDGLVAAIGNELATKDPVDHAPEGLNTETVQDGTADEAKLNLHLNESDVCTQSETVIGAGASELGSARCLNRVLKTSRVSMWLLAYIAIVSSWPVLGSALKMIFLKKFRGILRGSSAKS